MRHKTAPAYQKTDGHTGPKHGRGCPEKRCLPQKKQKVLMTASVASMIDQFNMPNIRLMQQLGYEVHVACNFRKGNTCDARRIRKLKQELDEMHVFRHQWDCPRSMHPLADSIRAYRQLRKLMQGHMFSWMHCQSPVGAALARIAAHRAGIPVIYTAHGFHFYHGAPLKNWLVYYPAEKLLAHWTDVIVTVNREDHQTAERHLKAARIYYIPGIGIDIRRFRAGAAERLKNAEAKGRRQEREAVCRKFGIPKDAWILLSVGELSRRKNHQLVITALARMEGKGPKDIYYIICGQGSRKQKLLRRARKLGMQERVVMAGYQPDTARLYRSADVFLFPSKQEGMPAALIEAMAAGLPCIVSDIRGNRELIKEHEGSMQPGGAVFQLKGSFGSSPPEQIKRQLNMLLAHEQLRRQCGSYNRKKAGAYALDAVNKRMKAIYQHMADRGGKGS